MAAIDDEAQGFLGLFATCHANPILQNPCDFARRSHGHVDVDEPFPRILVLIQKIGSAKLEPEHREVYNIELIRGCKIAEQQLGRLNEKVSRQSNQAFQGQFFASLMPYGPLTFSRAIRFHHQMARATNTSQPRHDILKLKLGRDNALFKRRRAGTAQELWGEFASRAEEFECGYVADADSHGTTLTGSHPSAKVEAKKVPRTQTET